MSRLSRRRFLQSVAAGSLAGTVAGCAPPSASDPARGGPAELVLFGGRVLLMDAGSTVAEAVAIKGGSVVAAGASCDMREWIGPRTTTYNLGGKTALPGINDAHLHGCPHRTRAAAVQPRRRSRRRVLHRRHRRGGGRGGESGHGGKWVRGKGWNGDELAERRLPTRADLDAVAPDVPVVLLDWSNHQLWMNSAALRLAGITAATQPPPGGVIVRDAAGEPTGLQGRRRARRHVGRPSPGASARSKYPARDRCRSWRPHG